MRKKLAVIFLVVFLDVFGFGIIIPVLPYYAKSFGASATVLGLLMLSFSAMQFLFSPFWGRLSDHYGRRPIILFCIVGMGVAMWFMGMAASLPWLFASRLLAGFFGANISAAFAYIADVTPPEKRAQGMGLVGAAFGLGFFFGPALGGLLSQWGYGIAAYGAAALSIVNFIVAIIILKEPRISEEVRRSHRRRFNLDIVRETLRRPNTGIIILLFFLATVGMSQIETTFALFLFARFGLGAWHAGLILALVGACMIAVQGGAIGFLVKRFGELKLVVTGLLLMAIGFTFAAKSFSMVLFACAILIHAVGYALQTPCLSSLVSRSAPSTTQGGTMGVYQSAGSLARIIGPVLAGVLFDRIGIEFPFYAAVVIVALAGGVAFLYRRPLSEIGRPEVPLEVEAEEVAMESLQ